MSFYVDVNAKNPLRMLAIAQTLKNGLKGFTKVILIT